MTIIYTVMMHCLLNRNKRNLFIFALYFSNLIPKTTSFNLFHSLCKVSYSSITTADTTTTTTTAIKPRFQTSRMLSNTNENDSNQLIEQSWKAYRLQDTQQIEQDWVTKLDLDLTKECLTNPAFLPHGDDGHSPRILLLYGSLRTKSFSKFLCYEFARILELLGCECRVFNPSELPQHDVEKHSNHPKVVELRSLSEWSEGQVWVSPEQHGAITGLFKCQLDWIPLSLGRYYYLYN